MNIRQLKDLIADLPDHMEVNVLNEEYDFPIRPVVKADIQEVAFRDEPTGPVLAMEKQLVIIHE